MGNLYGAVPTPLTSELTHELVRGASCRIERIVSWGQASPEGFFYDQEEDEWVVVLRGAAGLGFAPLQARAEPPLPVSAPASCDSCVADADECDEFSDANPDPAARRREGGPDEVVLREGDYIHIPAHVRHRVNWTLPGTFWLAVFHK